MSTIPRPFAWGTATPEQVCAEFKRLDAKFGTDARSPLHHDNRCKDCAVTLRAACRTCNECDHKRDLACPYHERFLVG